MLIFQTNPAATAKWRLDWNTLTEASQKFAAVLFSSAVIEDNFPMQVKATKKKEKKKKNLEFAVLE